MDEKRLDGVVGREYVRREHDHSGSVRVAEAQVDLRARPEAVQVVAVAGVVRVDVDRLSGWCSFDGGRVVVRGRRACRLRLLIVSHLLLLTVALSRNVPTHRFLSIDKRR